MIMYQRKFQYPLTLDLQLFAGKSATVEGQTFEIDDDPGNSAADEMDDADAEDLLDGISVDDDDANDDPDVDTDGAEDTDDDAAEDDSKGDKGDGKEGSKAGKEDAKKGDNHVAKAVIAERKRLQAQIAEANKKAALTEKLMKLIGVDDMSVLQVRLDAAEAARIAKETGVTPEVATAQLRQQRELENQRAEIRKLKYGQEVAALKSDPFFADIEDYREEFEEVAERTGQTLEEVYMAKRGRQRMKEYEREVEQRTLANKQKRDKTKVDTSTSGEQIKTEKHNLTPDQLAVAKAAVKMGHFKNVGEYAKYLKK